MKPWKVKHSHVAFDGSPYVRLLEQIVIDGKGQEIAPWYKIECKDFVTVVPLTRHGEIVLIEQYRHGILDTSIEVPSGSKEAEESSEAAAERELLEETGYAAESFVRLAGAISEDVSLHTNKFEIYIAINAYKKQEQRLDPNEDIEVMLKPFSEALKMAISGQIVNTPSLVAIFWTAFYTGNIKL